MPPPKPLRRRLSCSSSLTCWEISSPASRPAVESSAEELANREPSGAPRTPAGPRPRRVAHHRPHHRCRPAARELAADRFASALKLALVTGALPALLVLGAGQFSATWQRQMSWYRRLHLRGSICCSRAQPPRPRPRAPSSADDRSHRPGPVAPCLLFPVISLFASSPFLPFISFALCYREAAMDARGPPLRLMPRRLCRHRRLGRPPCPLQELRAHPAA